MELVSPHPPHRRFALGKNVAAVTSALQRLWMAVWRQRCQLHWQTHPARPYVGNWCTIAVDTPNDWEETACVFRRFILSIFAPLVLLIICLTVRLISTAVRVALRTASMRLH